MALVGAHDAHHADDASGLCRLDIGFGDLPHLAVQRAAHVLKDDGEIARAVVAGRPRGLLHHEVHVDRAFETLQIFDHLNVYRLSSMTERMSSDRNPLVRRRRQTPLPSSRGSAVFRISRL